MTFTRRSLLTALAVAVVVAPARAAPPADPAAFLHEIYRAIVADEGQTGGVELFNAPEVRPKTFSASLVALWAASDAKVPEGDAAVPDFDIFTDSQDPEVRDYGLTVKSATPTAAKIDVALKTRKADKKPYVVLNFSLVAEAGGWRIDDVAGGRGAEKWTLRKLLTQQ